jgi:hypothetical protein
MGRRRILVLAFAVAVVAATSTTLIAYDRAQGRRDAAELLDLDCAGADWVSVTNELDETEASPYASAEEALLAEWNRLYPKDLPEGLGVVETDSQDGFLAIGTAGDETEFLLVLDKESRARATVTRVEAGGFVVEGLTKC